MNTGDRPIQVGSHFHFAQVNDALAFDRAAARGLPAGRARGDVGALRARRRAGRRPGRARRRAEGAGAAMRISRERYGALYGPTVGDKLRLADTDLWLEVEEDRCVGGDEAVFGGGKTIRESMLQGVRTSAGGAPDTVITNVVVLDHWGIVKCDVGIKAGRISALGQGRQPGRDGRRAPGPRDRADDRDHRRRGADPDRGRDRRARALHLPADRRRGGGGGDDDADRRRHRAGRGHARDDLHAVAVGDPRDAAGDGRAAGQRAAARQGQHGLARGDARAGAGGRRAASSCTRTGARRRRRSTPACGSPTRPACRSRSTRTR